MEFSQPKRPDPYTYKEKVYLSLIGGLIIAFFFTFTAIFATVHSDPKPHPGVATVLEYFELDSTTEINFTSIITSPAQLVRGLNDSLLQVFQFNIGSTQSGAVVLLDEHYNMVNNITFVDAVSRIMNFRSNITRKGIYLRFHEPADVTPVLHLLSNFRNISSMPIWLGAKVMQGPGGSPAKFDPDWFIRKCREMLPSAFLSLGWTTGTNESSLEFTSQQINDMLYYADRYYLKPAEMVTLEVEVHSIIRSWRWMRVITDDPNHVLLISSTVPLDWPTRNWMYDNLNPMKGFYNQITYEPGVKQFWIY